MTISVSYRFDNAAILITGAGSGIGAALARHCARAGAVVIAVDRKHDALLDGLESAARELIDLQQVDISDNAAVETMLAAVRTKYPRLDAAVLGAAIQIRSEIGVMTAAQWREVIDVNLNGVFHCLNVIVPMMKAQKSGAIVAFTSGLATTGWPGASAYAASKAALVGIIKSVAHELRNYNVRANILSPGLRAHGDFHGRKHGRRTRILSELDWDRRAGRGGADAAVSNFGRVGEPDGRSDRATHHPGARTHGALTDGMGLAYWR